MPRIKSSIKDVRRTKRRRVANRAAQSQLKTAIRTVRRAAENEGGAKLQSACKVIDKATQSGLIHRNAGARYKSRLTKLVAKTATASAKTA